MAYIEMIELYSVSPEGFSGNWEYRDKVILTVSKKEEIEDVIEKAKTNFALKYGVDYRLINVFRDTGED